MMTTLPLTQAEVFALCKLQQKIDAGKEAEFEAQHLVSIIRARAGVPPGMKLTVGLDQGVILYEEQNNGNSTPST